MTLASELQIDFINAVKEYGTAVRLKFYTETYSGAQYDDPYLTVSGSSLWTWGRFDAVQGGDERKLIEAGKLVLGDCKLLLPGSYDNVDIHTKFGLGSPVTAEYCMVEGGKIPLRVSGTTIFNRIYVRALPTGSFIQEV